VAKGILKMKLYFGGCVKLYLTPELQAHRRGRFLASLLGISQTSELGLPKTGFVLMTGEALQASRDSGGMCGLGTPTRLFITATPAIPGGDCFPFSGLGG
jgi:hypothetical protein